MSKSGPKVFISYTHDSDDHVAWVRALAQRLERHGADVWFDGRLVPGSRWADDMQDVSKKAEVALVVCSSNLARSKWVDHELSVFWPRAQSNDIRLIPILRAGNWDDLPGELSEWQGVDMRDDARFLDAFARLRRGIFGDDGRASNAFPSGAVDALAARRLRRLRLRNVKLFDDLEFDLTDGAGEPRSWTCILADNGCGKTSVLQAITLAASGDTLATKLTDDPRAFVPAFADESNVSIEAEFVRGADDILQTRLELAPGSYDWAGVGPDDGLLRELRGSRKKDFFVAAFGATRRLARAGQVAVPTDPVLSRVRNLFDGEHQLMGLEFGEVFHDDALREAFLGALAKVVAMEGPESKPLLPGIVEVGTAEEAVPGAGPGDVVVTLDSGSDRFQLGPSILSSGYQSVLSWVGELVGHLLLDFGPNIDPFSQRGLVLIDELDQHLHPTWQRRIVPILRTMFPKMQFIVTTHSPLVLTGFAASEIVALELEGGRLVQRVDPIPEPGMQSGSQLYSSFFETPIAARPGLEDKEREARRLHARLREGLSDEETQRLRELDEELAPYWTTPLRDPMTKSDAPDVEKLRSILGDLGASS